MLRCRCYYTTGTPTGHEGHALWRGDEFPVSAQITTGFRSSRIGLQLQTVQLSRDLGRQLNGESLVMQENLG